MNFNSLLFAGHRDYILQDTVQEYFLHHCTSDVTWECYKDNCETEG